MNSGTYRQKLSMPSRPWSIAIYAFATILLSACQQRRTQQPTVVAPAKSPAVESQSSDQVSATSSPSTSAAIENTPSENVVNGNIIVTASDAGTATATSEVLEATSETNKVTNVVNTSTTPSTAITVDQNGYRLGELIVKAPDGLALIQKATNEGVSLLSFGSSERLLSIYTRKGSSVTLKAMFLDAGAKTTAAESSQKIGKYDWKIVKTSKTVASGPHQGTYHVAGFLLEQNGSQYYGYARATSAETAQKDLEQWLGKIE